MIAIDRWPPTPKQYVALKAAGRIRHVPDEREQAADEQRAAERERERAVKQADALVRAARTEAER